MKKVYVYKGEWCQPCKMYAPIVQKVKSEIQGVEFEIIDVDSGDPRIIEHGIRNVPTTVVLEGDKVISKQSGMIGEDQLKQMIE